MQEGSSPTVREGSFSKARGLKVRIEIMQDNELIEKIESLPPDQIADVMDFGNCLAHRDDQLSIEAASSLSEPTFAAVWNNPDDAEYDQMMASEVP